MVEVKKTKLLFLFGIIAISTFLLTQPIKIANGQETLTSVNPFVIDGLGVDGYTWEEISLLSWCSGNGTSENPYIIENIKINHIPLEYGHCLAIENSEVHFIIRYSIFHAAGGQILDPQQSWGGNGIWLYNTSNGIIANNTCYNNGNNGIELVEQSRNNLVINNTCYGNDDHGIYISAYCENNTAIKNNIGTNENSGISTFRAYNNRIINNSVIGNNHYGVYLRDSDYNTVKGNFIDHVYSGIYLEDSHHNNITFNEVYYYQSTITGSGVGNIIENNTFIFDDFMPPYISINKPQENQIFNHTAPNFNIFISERLVTGIESQYYTINNGVENYSFALTNIRTGVDFISGEGIGVINQEVWNGLNEGNITIRFYAKDNNGNIAYKEVSIIKYIPEPNRASISGFHPLIMIGIIVFLSVILNYKKITKNY